MSDNKKEDKTLADFKKMVQESGLTSKVLNSMKKIFSDKTVERFVEQFLIDMSLGGEDFDPATAMKVSKLPEGIMQLMNMMKDRKTT